MTDTARHWNGTDIPLRPGSYWHLTEPRGILKHNARIGKGFVISNSVTAEQLGLENVVSPYSFAKQNDPKEVVWEEVRKAGFGHLPSRMKSLYCFERKELADRAAREWFGGEQREAIELRLPVHTVLHRCDSKLLDAHSPQWPENAKRYWQGEMTSNPMPEVLVHGAFYVVPWESFPLGF